jgi:hypothetical protein
MPNLSLYPDALQREALLDPRVIEKLIKSGERILAVELIYLRQKEYDA